MNNSIKQKEFIPQLCDKKAIHFINKLGVVNDELMKWIQLIYPERVIDEIGSYRIRVDSLKQCVYFRLFSYQGFTPTDEEMQELDVLYDDIVEGNVIWSTPKFLRRLLMEEVILTESDFVDRVNLLCNELLDRVTSRK